MGKFFFIFFIYHLFRAFFIGVTTPPLEGDSLAYHIPIAQEMWNGGLFHPKDILHFYPSVGEAILSIFYLFHIPANIFNVVGTILLFLAARILGKQSGLKNELPTIFAVAVCLLPITLRWINTQVIDVWLAIFFVWSLVLLQKPKKSAKYYLLLGTSLGLLIGTKNSGPVFAALLLVVYWENIKGYLQPKNVFNFAIPVSILGIFWYVRNVFLVGNPLYPQAILGLKGAPNWDILMWCVGEIAIWYPDKIFNALISEYMVWSIAVILPLLFIRRIHDSGDVKKLLLVGYANLAFFFFLPTSPEYSIIVSSFRYAYPMIIPLMLVTFFILQRIKKEKIIMLLSLANILFLPGYEYQPKLLFIFIIGVLLYFHKHDKATNNSVF